MDLIIQDIIDGRLPAKDQFIDAIRNNNLEMISLLLGLGLVDINFVDADGNTPLMIATTQNYIEIVKMLINNDANRDLTNNYGVTALIFAAFFDYMDLVKFLVESGVNLDLTNKDGRSALIIATNKKYNNVARFLVESGANLDLTDKNNKTALDYVDDEELKKFILDTSAINLIDKYIADAKLEDCIDGCELALVKAARENKFDIIDKLLYFKDKLKLKINYTDKAGCTALFSATMRGYIEIVQILVDNDADPNILSNTDHCALHWATFFGYTSIVKILVDHGAKVDESILILAAKGDFMDIFKILVDACDNIDSITPVFGYPINYTMSKIISDAIAKKSYDKLTAEGYCNVGTVLKEGDVIIGMINPKPTSRDDYCKNYEYQKNDAGEKGLKCDDGEKGLKGDAGEKGPKGEVEEKSDKGLAETANVKVIEVLWRLSKDGKLIPRIHFEKVRLSHADLAYTAGFNAKFIVDNMIGPGAIITIIRSGDNYIPYITGVVKPANKPSLPIEYDYEWDKNKVNIFILKDADENAKVESDKSEKHGCTDMHGKEYPLIDEIEVARLIYQKSLPTPKIHHAILQPIGMIKVKCWLNNRWTDSTFHNINIEIQIPKDKNYKIEYHVLQYGNDTELYVKFPSNLIISVKNESQPLGDIYRK